MPYFHYQSKKIYYRETGFGKPLVMLHGDTASSVMFEFLLPLYQESFRVILMDFLGNGKSDRVEGFPENLWITEAEQVIGLIEHLKLEKVNLLGTSGGAWVAVNTALKRPDLIDRVVADSFDGRTLHEDFAENLLKALRTTFYRKEKWQSMIFMQDNFMNGVRAKTGKLSWI